MRAAQDPAALARRVARLGEEGEELRAELRVCQQQLTALLEKIDAGSRTDSELGRQLARLQAQQERQAGEPGQFVESAIRQLREDLDRRWAVMQRQSDQIGNLSRKLDEIHGLTTTVESVRRNLDDLHRQAEESQRAYQAERQSAATALASLREAIGRAVLSLDAQQREQQRLVDEIAGLQAGQGGQQAEQLVALHQAVEALSARLEQAQAAGESANRAAAAPPPREPAQAPTYVELVEADIASAAEQEAKTQALRLDLEGLREQVAALADAAKQAQATADAAARRATAVDEARASGSVQLQQRLGELQTENEALRQALTAIQSSFAAEHRDVGAALDAIRGQLSRLQEAQSRQEEIAQAVGRAQASADRAARRVTANEETQAASAATLQQQLDALQAESGSWREMVRAVPSVVARQEVSAGEVEVLRAQVSRLLDAQRRQQELLEDLSLAPVEGGEPPAGEFSETTELASLRRQVVALQADRLNLDAFLENRFEVLCGILDAELRAGLDELRSSLRSPGDALSPKLLTETLSRVTSSLAALRKKPR